MFRAFIVGVLMLAVSACGMSGGQGDPCEGHSNLVPTGCSDGAGGAPTE